MSKKELGRVGVIHKSIERTIKQRDVAQILSLSIRQVRRITKKVKIHGDSGIIHGNRGKSSNRKFPDEFKEKVLQRVKQKYYDFGPTFTSEKLRETDNLKVNRETLRQWMVEEHIWIPRRLRDEGTTHQWRKRKDCFGELVQTDGSIHDWLEGRGPEMVLMAYIDDATGNPFARFYQQETTYAAMDSFRRYIKKYGIPQSLYFDRNSIYKTIRQANLDEELRDATPKTQFEKVLDILNVEPIHAYSPQAKGRVERLFGIFQDRLIKELRLAGVCDIDRANTFLAEYLPKHSSLFAIPPANSKNLHKPIPPDLDLDWVFAFREKRAISNDFTISWKNRVFLITKPSIAFKRERVIVMENLKGEIRIWFHNRFLEFREITKDTLQQMRKRKSLHKSPGKKTSSKPWKPPVNHPWRIQNKTIFMELQK